MKVLFAGPYKDNSGWAHAAQEYILALDAVGIDVVPRAIKLNLQVNPPIPQTITELESKSDRGCDVIIQNILPHMFDFDGRFKQNVGLIFTETSHFKNISPFLFFHRQLSFAVFFTAYRLLFTAYNFLFYHHRPLSW